jgi:hypothetical protein
MKTRRSLVLLFASVLTLSVLLPGAATGRGTPRHLSNAAARKAAVPAAWDVARENPSVNSVKLRRCARQAADRFVCLAVDRGSSSQLATTCRVWIRVAGTDASPNATVRLIKCKNHRYALLKAADAETALLAEAQTFGGSEVTVAIIARFNRLELAALAGWTRPAIADPRRKEFCGADLRATLVGDQIEVRVTRGPFCLLPNS